MRASCLSACLYLPLQAKGVSLGLERNQFARTAALAAAGVTLEEKLAVLFYRMDPTAKRFPDIVDIAMDIKDGHLCTESPLLHTTAPGIGEYCPERARRPVVSSVAFARALCL